MKRRTWLMLWLAAFVVGLIAFLPASLLEGPANRALAPQAILTNTSGTVWSGRGSLQAADTATVLTWRFDPFSLLRLRIGFVVDADSPKLSGRANVGVGLASLAIRDADIKLDADMLARGVPALALVAPQGQLRVLIDGDNAVRIGHGDQTLQGALTLRADQFALRNLNPETLGSYDFHLTLSGHRIDFVVAKSAGLLKLDGGGNVVLTAPREFQIDGYASTTSAPLASALKSLGQAQADGRVRIVQRGGW